MNTGLFSLSTVKLHGSMAALRRASALGSRNLQEIAARRRSPERKNRLKIKDPSGGTTGRVKPYGRLGWMGARAEYSRWGGITAPTFISRSRVAGRSKRRAIFLAFCRGLRRGNHCAEGRIALVCGRFFRRHRRPPGLVQRPAHGSVIGSRRFSGRRLAPEQRRPVPPARRQRR